MFLAALRAGDREKFIMPFFTGLLSLSAWLGWVGELGKLRVDPVICNLAQHKPHQDCPTRQGACLSLCLTQLIRSPAKIPGAQVNVQLLHDYRLGA